jgi:glutamate/tyrosine decarboxylase-like PLP-dependent enzyme
MNKTLQTDFDSIENLLELTKNQGVDFLKTLHERPTSTAKSMGNFGFLPENGLGTKEALADFNQRFEPIIMASTGPRYWGFVTGGATPASIVGDWLSGIYDQNSQSVKGDGDVSARIELETIQLLLDLFELPKTYFGGFVTGATMSNFTSLAVARQWIGKQSGKDFAKEGISEKIHVFTAVPHSSAVKSLAMLGLGSQNFTKIKVLEGNREAMDVQDLAQKLEALNGQPAIVIASGGTVNTVDFDDFVAIAKLKEKYQFWCHIDAAFGGFAVCSPTHKHLLNGWEMADSITVDCHKWLNVPYESAFFLVKEEHRLIQIETFQNSNAPYLGDPLDNFSYLNFLPENSRRLRALPAWFSLMAYGKKGYQDIVENSIKMAQIFGEYLENHTQIELLSPTRLNTICFTLVGEEGQEKVGSFLSKLNATGKVFMTPTAYNGKKGIRAAFVNWQTNEQDIEIVKTEMEKVLVDF